MIREDTILSDSNEMLCKEFIETFWKTAEQVYETVLDFYELKEDKLATIYSIAAFKIFEGMVRNLPDDSELVSIIGEELDHRGLLDKMKIKEE